MHDQMKEWYGNNSRILEYRDDCIKLDYGCKCGRGLLSIHSLMGGIYACLLDFDTPEPLSQEVSDGGLLSITYSLEGCCESAFSDNTHAFLAQNRFSAMVSRHAPKSYLFPQGVFKGVNIVVDASEFDALTSSCLDTFAVNAERLAERLNLDGEWYVSKAQPQMDAAFRELAVALQANSSATARLKAVEVLHLLCGLPPVCGERAVYYPSSLIAKVKSIYETMLGSPQGTVSIAELARRQGISLTLFQRVFAQIYGDSPSAYVRDQRMRRAAQRLANEDVSIGAIASECGYSNASKFASAFSAVMGFTPRDYRLQHQSPPPAAK
jgi:AraC-like DNA-binding protein